MKNGERGTGIASPTPVDVRVTRRGRRALTRWLDRPVDHVRDVRSAFLLKLALLDRAGRDRDELVAKQLEELAPVCEGLRKPVRGGGFDAVLAGWRRESALGVRRFLESLLRVPR